MSSQKKTLGIVFFTVFMDLVGFGILIPIQPFFAQKLGASPAVITLLGASFSLMQFLFAPIWGRLSDRIGRRPIMLLSIALTAVGYAIFGFAESLTVLFLARMLSGLGSANIGTAQAIIADSTEPSERAKGMGLIGAAFGLGFIFGPAIGGLFSQFSLSTPAIVAAGLSLLNFISALMFLPETNPLKVKGQAVQTASHSSLSWAALRHAARHRNVGELFAFQLLFSTSFSLMEQVLGLFIQHYWVSGEGPVTLFQARHSAALTSYVLIVVGVTATIVQGGLIGKLAKRFGEHKLLVAGPLFVALSFLLTPVWGWVGVFSLLMANYILTAIGTGVTHPSWSSLLSLSVDADERGGALGLGQSLAALGRVLGPSVSGLLFQWRPAAPFLTGAILLAGCGLLSSRLTVSRVD